MLRLPAPLVATVGQWLTGRERSSYEATARAVRAALQQYATASWPPALCCDALCPPPARARAALRLTRLELDNCPPHSLDWLASPLFQTRLRVLALHPCTDVPTPARMTAEHFAAIGALPALTELDLRRLVLPAGWTKALGTRVARVQTLRLIECTLLVPAEIVDLRPWVALETLVCGNNTITRGQARYLPPSVRSAVASLGLADDWASRVRDVTVLLPSRETMMWLAPHKDYFQGAAALTLCRAPLWSGQPLPWAQWSGYPVDSTSHGPSLAWQRFSLPGGLARLAWIDCFAPYGLLQLEPAQHGSHATLTTLALVGTSMDVAGMRVVATLPSLHALTLINCGLASDSLGPLSRSRAPLKLVDLSNDARRPHYRNQQPRLDVLRRFTLRRVCLHNVEDAPRRQAPPAWLRALPICTGPTRHRRILEMPF